MSKSPDQNLSDDEIDVLEAEIPALAAIATRHAYDRALFQGLTVYVARGRELVAVTKGQSDQVIKSLNPKYKVTINSTVKLKKISD